jgi:hypothetical protein
MEETDDRQREEAAGVAFFSAVSLVTTGREPRMEEIDDRQREEAAVVPVFSAVTL